MKILFNYTFLLFISLGLLFSQMPVSKEATLIEAVSSSEWLIEATGKYMSPEKREKKAKKDVNKNGISRATDDAKKAVVYFVLFGGTDPLISSTTERQKFDKYESFYFDMSNVSRYISWEESALQKKIKISGGKGLKIVKRFKINKTILMKDLENHNILEARDDLADVLGNPFIMVIPAVPKGGNPVELLQTNPKIRHAASVVESYLTARQYDVVVPSAMENLENLNSAQMSLGDREEDFGYQLALSIGSDIYITFSGASESAGYGTEKYSMIVRAYETTTARLLGTETGYSQSRKGEVMVSIEEAMNGAIDNVLSRLKNYWKSDLKNGIQYKLVVNISTDFDEDEAEAISFAFMDAVEEIANKSKENISTSQTLDYLLWCDPGKYDKSSKVYRYLKKKFKNFVEEEGVDAKLRKLNVNRKMILLKIDTD